MKVHEDRVNRVVTLLDGRGWQVVFSRYEGGEKGAQLFCDVTYEGRDAPLTAMPWEVAQRLSVLLREALLHEVCEGIVYPVVRAAEER